MYKKLLTHREVADNDFSDLKKWIMRTNLTGLLILVFFLKAGFSANGQNVSIDTKNVSITAVFKELKKQSGYDFVYTAKLINNARPTHINVRNQPFEKVLDMYFKDQPFSYLIDNRTVVVVPKISLSSVENTQAQNTIKGRIVNQNGKPLSKASIKMKNTNKVTSTNENGEFELAQANVGDILLISYIGYQTKEWPIKSKGNFLVITLTETASELDETLVIGYGTAKKLTYTGSVSTIESKDIIKNGTPNLTDALVGRLPGLNVMRSTGNEPGSSASFNVRGMNTINDEKHTNTPLIIIDGMQRNFSSGTLETDVFASLDPNDIESISVLKDASAAAVYGARAANGVILITTKRGKEEKPTLSYNFLYGIDKPTRMPTPLNSWDWATLYNEALRNDVRDANGNIPASFKPVYSDEDIQKFRDGSDPDHYANTNWLKEILKPTAQQQQHNLSLRGGSKSVNYFVSLGHTDQGAYIDAYNFKRYNLRSNIDADVNKSLRVSVDLAGSYTQTDSPPGYTHTVFGDMLRASPVYPNQYQSDPSKYGVVSGLNDRFNPYLETKRGYNHNNKMSLFSTLSAVQQLGFVPGLSLKGLFSFNKTYGDQKVWSKSNILFTDDGLYYKDNVFGGAYLREDHSRFQSITSELHLNYARNFGKHDIKGLILFTQSKDYTRGFSASRRKFLSTSVEELSAGEAEGQDINSAVQESARRGFVGRFNYNYDQKYLLEANFRYDGSSNFPKGNRWGFFPSFAAGWNISEEAFIKDNTALSFINLLKVRASWGQLGNDRIYASFAYLDQFNMNYGKIYLGNNLMSILTPSALSNPDITWEKATTSNIGLEAQLWNGLLGMEMDYFKKRTTDILAQPTLAFPKTFGADLPMLNNSTVGNEGFEIALTHRFKRGDFGYSIKPNIGLSKSKIIFTPESQSNPNLVRSGRTQDYLNFGYQSLGLFQSYDEIAKSPVQNFGIVQPGDIKYADISGPDGVADGKVDAFDRTKIGSPSEPKITYGIAGDISYKAFDMSFLFQGVEKTSLDLSGDPGWAFASDLLTLGSAYEHHLDRWTPENTDASYPRLFYSSTNNKVPSSYWFRDASYLRLKNLTIGYTLPKELTERIKIGHMRVFASGTNLITWDKLKTFDPELRGIFSTGGFYPLQKTFNMGLNITF